jgi:hypothetical protein
MTNILTIGAAGKSARQISPSGELSEAFASTLNGTKSDQRSKTDQRRKDGILPPIDPLAAANNIQQQVPNVTYPVRLWAEMGPKSVGYHAQRDAGAVILRSAAAPGDPLNGHSYRVTPGPTSTIIVNGVPLSSLPQPSQRMHLLGLRRATFVVEQGDPLEIRIRGNEKV